MIKKKNVFIRLGVVADSEYCSLIFPTGIQFQMVSCATFNPFFGFVRILAVVENPCFA